MSHVQQAQQQFKALWASSPLLVGTACLTLVTLILCLFGLYADPRLILGAPAWLKPAKFSISISVFCWSMAWIFRFMPERKRLNSVAGWTFSLGMLVELAIIVLQAWRGTTSHFNEQTPFDALCFHVMGLDIILITCVTIAVWIGLLQQKFQSLAFGQMLRLALGISILGSLVAGFMLPPTPAQLAHTTIRQDRPIEGAHTVGAPDGNPGLPLTNWSRKHGDLRIPHFLGLHALQILPLIYALFLRKRTEAQKLKAINAVAVSYTGLMGILLWQALRGQGLLIPDSWTIIALALWSLLTLGMLSGTSRRSPATFDSSTFYFRL